MCYLEAYNQRGLRGDAGCCVSSRSTESLRCVCSHLIWPEFLIEFCKVIENNTALMVGC